VYRHCFEGKDSVDLVERLRRYYARYAEAGKEPELGGCNKAQTYLVVIKTKDGNGNVTETMPLQTIVATSPKQAEQKAIVELAKKGEEFKEGMEATARPFNQS